MRARRCNECGERFYVNPAAPSSSCQDCSGSHDPSVQAEADAARIATVNTSRVAGRRKQTLDINKLRDEVEAPPAPPKGRKPGA